MLNSIQVMINYLKFEYGVNSSARRFASSLESYHYHNKDLTVKQLAKLIEIYQEYEGA